MFEIRIEQTNANDTTALLTAWLVADGGWVAAGEPVASAETAKVSVELSAPHDGYLARMASVGDELGVGDVVAYVCVDQKEAAAVTARAPEAEADAVAGSGRFSAPAATYVREHGLSLADFDGYQLVTLNDARSVHDRLRPAGDDAAPRGRAGVEPLSRAKTLEVARLAEANVLTAALSIQFGGVGLRRSAASAALPAVGVLARVVNAVATALRSFPNLNAYFDDGIRRHPSIDVGVAIDLGAGLKVGVVHHADGLDLDQTEDRLIDLVSRYIDGTLTPDDVSAASTTVSDLSVEDVLYFQPLLNHRQALGIGVGGDARQADEPLTLTATFDHRVSSGREVSRFLARCRHELSP